MISDEGEARVRMVAGYSCSATCPYGLSSMTAGDIYDVAGDGVSGVSADGTTAQTAEL